jgi:hypothetical protein
MKPESVVVCQAALIKLLNSEKIRRFENKPNNREESNRRFYGLYSNP